MHTKGFSLFQNSVHRSNCRRHRRPCMRRRRPIWRALLLSSLIPLLFANDGFSQDEDLPTVEQGLLDFTEIDIEDLVETDTVVIELEKAREVTLQEGILGAHVHKAGEWMVGYQFMFMNMDGNRIGRREVSDNDVLADGFLVTPTDMEMEGHMWHVMYGFSDRFTGMIMLPYKRLSMDHLTASGRRFTTNSEGVGDLSLTGLFTFYDSKCRTVCDKDADKDCWNTSWDQLRQANFGLSFYIPTGSIDERDDTPMGSDRKLPYPMQLGSGTFDLEPSLNYLSITPNWAWGANVAAKFRMMDENSNNYRLGHEFRFAAWLARKLSDHHSVDVRLSHLNWGNINGADPDLNPAIVPTADPNLRGGDRTDVWFGLHIYVPEGALEGNRVFFEFGLPIHQVLDGPQLETNWMLRTGWSWTF